MENALTVKQETAIVAESNQSMITRVKNRIQTLQTIYREIMVEGKNGSDGDYGLIPGCGDKPALKKAGAEKLILGFRVSPTIGENIKIREYENGHREVSIVCTLTGPGGEILGEGVGSCSTLESKYRYRNVADYDITGLPIPKDSKEKSKEYRKQGFGMKKVDGVWEWVKYKDSSRQENPDIADQYNTVLKMAKKRALIDAVLTVFGASDLFAQDVDEMQPQATDEPLKPVQPKPEQKQAAEPQAGKSQHEKNIVFVAIRFTEEAKKTPLDSNLYNTVRMQYIQEVLNLPAPIETSKDLTPAQVDTLCKIIRETPETIGDFISTFLDKEPK